MIAGINKLYILNPSNVTEKGFSVKNTRLGLVFSGSLEELSISRDTAQFISDFDGVKYNHTIKYSKFTSLAKDIDFAKRLHQRAVIAVVVLNSGETIIVGVNNPLRVKFNYYTGKALPDDVGYSIEMVSNSKTPFEFYDFINIPEYTNIKNGLLYNWYAVTDERSICSAGWRVPSKSDFETILNHLNAEVIPPNPGEAGVYYSGVCNGLKDNNSDYWNSNTGTNIFKFNARGSGILWGSIAGMEFISIKNEGTYHSSSLSEYDNPIHFDISDNDDIVYLGNVPAAPSRSMGRSVRLVRNTSNSDYTEGSYYGNDGKIYRTICIGGLEITADNLAETKYANNDDIENVVDLLAWVTLTTGACCAYNNDPANV